MTCGIKHISYTECQVLTVTDYTKAMLTKKGLSLIYHRHGHYIRHTTMVSTTKLKSVSNKYEPTSSFSFSNGILK